MESQAKFKSGDIVSLDEKEGVVVNGDQVLHATYAMLHQVALLGGLLNECQRLAHEDALNCPDYEEGHVHGAHLPINEGPGREVLQELFNAAKALGEIYNVLAAASWRGKEPPKQSKPLPMPTVHSHGHG